MLLLKKKVKKNKIKFVGVLNDQDNLQLDTNDLFLCSVE